MPEQLTETKERVCLIEGCGRHAPKNIKDSEMSLNSKRTKWYSNAMMDSITGTVYARFWLCPDHHGRTVEAWLWAQRQPRPEA